MVSRKRPDQDARPTAGRRLAGDCTIRRIDDEGWDNRRCPPRLRRVSGSYTEFYRTSNCNVRVLAARPLRVRESWATELFGDYNPETTVIRLWMRTAVRKQITSYGTFLSTLCHEFCHHLDFQRFGFADSWHTRGFYERAAALYHHARGAPQKRLFWVPMSGGRWRIDWPKTNRTT